MRVGLPVDIDGAVAGLLLSEFGWMAAQHVKCIGGRNV